MTATSQPSPSPPIGAGAVLAVAAAIILPLSAIAPLAIAPLGAVLAIALAVLLAVGWQARPAIDRTAVIVVAALIVWLSVTVLWSIAPDRAIATAGRLALIAIAGCLTIAIAASLDEEPRRRIRRALTAGTIVAVTALLVIATAIHLTPAISGDQSPAAFRRIAALLIGFNRTASIIALMAWPVCVALARRKPAWGIFLFAVIALVLLLLNSSTPVLAIGLASIVFAVAVVHARIAAVALVGAIVLMTAITPGFNRLLPTIDRVSAAAQYENGSVDHRLQIWSFAATRAKERPFTGWGLEASRALGSGAVDTSSPGLQSSAEVLPLHPHNALLQVWVELGLPGAILTAALLVWLVVRTGFREPDRLQRAAILSAMTAALVVAELSYGLWQGWWQATLWLTAALIVATGPGRNPVRAAA